MKLSELKTLVERISAAATPANPDPEITFWHDRSPKNMDYKPGSVYNDYDIGPCDLVAGHRTRELNYQFPLERI